MPRSIWNGAIAFGAVGIGHAFDDGAVFADQPVATVGERLARELGPEDECLVKGCARGHSASTSSHRPTGCTDAGGTTCLTVQERPELPARDQRVPAAQLVPMPGDGRPVGDGRPGPVATALREALEKRMGVAG